MEKRRYFLQFCALILAAALLLTGCGGGQTPASSSSGAPKSQISGYYSADQSVSGGTDLNVINLRDIKIDKVRSDYEITFEFVEGSINLGMEEKATNGVPKYTTQWIDGLDRLVLKISGLYYWDYEVYEDEIKDTPILGIFRQNPVNSADTRIYINLKDKIAYKIEEKGNLLHLYLRAIPGEEHSDYYVLLNAFDDYTNGSILDSEGLFPTLCSDKTNVMLISKPFGSEEEAKAFLQEKQSTLLAKLPGKNATVMELKNNELPVYDEKGAMAAYASTPATRVNGKETVSPPFITNGQFLCWKPDGSAYVYVTPFYLNDSSGSGTSMYEKIYVNDVGSTTPTLLNGFEYSNILKAEFSDDGRYLAFLDLQGGKQALYIYDTQSMQVSTASEKGFGDDTASFTWGSGDDITKHTIFAITGEDSSLQLMSYTLEDNKLATVQTLLESAFTGGGTMGFYDGKVYYSQYSEDTAQNGIFTFDPATRTTARVCDGDDFFMNRPTGNIAVLSVASEEEQTFDLTLYNAKTQAQESIVKGVPFADGVWSSDGSVFYYTVYKDDGTGDDSSAGDRFKLTLHRYGVSDKSNPEICDIVMGALGPSDKNSELLLTYLFTQEDQVTIPITFRISAGQ